MKMRTISQLNTNSILIEVCVTYIRITLEVQYSHKPMKKFAKVLFWQTEVQNVLGILVLGVLAIYKNARQMAVRANENTAILFPCVLHFGFGIFKSN